MKIKAVGSELTDADIQAISLVKHGAIRAPFKIVKTDALKTFSPTLAEKVVGFLSTSVKTGDMPIVAVWAKEEAVECVKTAMTACGLSVESAETKDGVTVFKQEGFDPEKEGTAIAVTEGVLVGLGGVCKSFSSYTPSTEFNDVLSANSFFPSLYLGLSSLEETIRNVMYTDGIAKDEMGQKVSSAITELGTYVQGLFRELPETLFKFDGMLHQGFESSNVQSQVVIIKGDDAMANTIREAVAGDHAGLDEPVAKTEVAPVAAPVEPVVAKTETPVAVIESDKVMDPLAAFAATLSQSIATLTGTMATLLAKMDEQNTRIDEISKTAGVALQKADNTTLVPRQNIDESFTSSTNRARTPMKKGEVEPVGVFDNLFVDITQGRMFRE